MVKDVESLGACAEEVLGSPAPAPSAFGLFSLDDGGLGTATRKVNQVSARDHYHRNSPGFPLLFKLTICLESVLGFLPIPHK